jgi:chromosome partitioning protein
MECAMKIIAFVNNKGGVGKTTCSRLMAEYLTIVQKKRVLAIDFDPQCNFSNRFIQMEVDPASKEGRMPPLHPHYNPHDPDDADWDGRSSIAEIFYGRSVIPYPTYIQNLDLAPGYGEKLIEAEAVRKSEMTEKIHKRLAEFLGGDDVRSAYDAVVIDTAPSKGPLTVSVIRAATHIVIPAVMEEQPIEGVYGMMQLWLQENVLRSKNNPLNLVGILPTFYKSGTILHRDMLESLSKNIELGKYVLPVKIGNKIIYPELDAQNANPKSIFNLGQKNKQCREETMNVYDHISRRIFQ